MNCKVVALLVVLCAVMLTDIDALRLRIRGRRILNRIKRPLCKNVCSYACTAATSGSAAPVCGFGCHKLCDRLRRSSEKVNDETTFSVPLPRNFDLYDTNKDGLISIEEFADLFDLDPSQSGVKETFTYADSDGDSYISKSEFLEAPWEFEDDDVDAADAGL